MGRPLKSAKRSNWGSAAFLSALELAQQIVDQHLGVDLLLDVKGRGMNHQVRPVLFVLTAPDQLRVQIAISALFFFVESGHAALKGDADRVLDLLGHDRLILDRRDVLAGRFLVLEGFDGQLVGFLCHSSILPVYSSVPFVPFMSALSGLCWVSSEPFEPFMSRLRRV